MSELERLVSVLAACEHPAVLIQEFRTTAGDPVRRCLQCGAISHTEAETGWKPWAPSLLVNLVCEEARKEAEEVPAPGRDTDLTEERLERQRDLIDAALADARRGVKSSDYIGTEKFRDAFRYLDAALSTGQPLPKAWQRTSHDDLFLEYLRLHERARVAASDRDGCLTAVAGILREADRAPKRITRAVCPHCDHSISLHNLPGSPGALGFGCLVDGCKCKREIFTAAERGESSVTGETANAMAKRWAAEDRAQRDPLGPARMLGHVLGYGRRALCGFMADRDPKDWPPGHYFVTLKQVTWSYSGGHGKVTIPPEFKFEPC